MGDPSPSSCYASRVRSRLRLVTTLACGWGLVLSSAPARAASPTADEGGSLDGEDSGVEESSNDPVPPPKLSMDAMDAMDEMDATDPKARKQGPEATVGVLSEGGRDRGELELGLGSVTLAVGAGLVAIGAIELRRGLDRRARCEAEFNDACTLDPPGLIFASSALSFAFSVPALVGGSLLLRKGILIHRDWRAFGAMHEGATSSRSGAPGSRRAHDASLGILRAQPRRPRLSAAPAWWGRRGAGVNVQVRF